MRGRGKGIIVTSNVFLRFHLLKEELPSTTDDGIKSTSDDQEFNVEFTYRSLNLFWGWLALNTEASTETVVGSF